MSAPSGALDSPMLQEQPSAVPVSLQPGRPLAPMQRSLWMSQRRDAVALMQNMALLIEIEGAIDVARLVAAFAEVVNASDALRTRIVDDGGGPRGRCREEPAPTEVIELAGLDAD